MVTFDYRYCTKYDSRFSIIIDRFGESCKLDPPDLI
jgi:hypothetical protein